MISSCCPSLPATKPVNASLLPARSLMPSSPSRRAMAKRRPLPSSWASVKPALGARVKVRPSGEMPSGPDRMRPLPELVPETEPPATATV
ncbi:MAG: hypothetical protein D6702_09680 [Planctomycetota bacterium]|nr:MAG: hypothetical protein D6702_09680 [Planctomycetota bacterium]